MLLLTYARARYASLAEREQGSSSAGGKRVGGLGVVELGEERRRVIYEDDTGRRAGKREKEREKEKDREKDWEKEKGGKDGEGEGERETRRFGGVERYAMVGKRIW